jgi:glutathione reductase (NADPH)
MPAISMIWSPASGPIVSAPRACVSRAKCNGKRPASSIVGFRTAGHPAARGAGSEGELASYDYDLFTLGAGSGGVRASRMSAQFGARVAVAEERYLGGTCVNVGCIPKKLLVYASHYREDFRDATAYGFAPPESSFDWGTLIRNKNREIERLNGVYRRLLRDAGVELFEGRARLVDAHTVAIGDRRVSARHILIATGGWPSVPDVPGAEHAITSNEAFFLEALPRRVLIVGGGYIAVEFAGIFHGLGAQVTQLYRGPLFLRGFDDDVRKALAAEMVKRGIDLRFDTNVERIERVEKGLRATLCSGEALETDCVQFATGRHPNTKDLGLEAAGVALDRGGAVIVDEYSRSNVGSISAIGDVTDRLALTPVAIHEGMALAKTLFGNEPTRPDHANVPSCVFSQPNVGTVGLTEGEARERHGDAAIDVYKTSFRPLKHTLTGTDEATLMKLVVHRESDRVLGCHMVGPDAGETMQGLAVAIQCAATKAQFDATVAIHPTAAEEFVTLREKAPAA